ncbi:hypothetical protein MMC11_004987 [Xylographa trunciseda]|nr:hypothetical protein [Xylographa trunciseda]
MLLKKLLKKRPRATTKARRTMTQNRYLVMLLYQMEMEAKRRRIIAHEAKVARGHVTSKLRIMQNVDDLRDDQNSAAAKNAGTGNTALHTEPRDKADSNPTSNESATCKIVDS